MPNLVYPRTLVAGTPENVNHVQENFVALRDLVNGNLDAANLATSAKPQTLLGEWRTVHQWNVVCQRVPNTNIHYAEFFSSTESGSGGTPLLAHFDPLAHQVIGLTAKGRMRLAFGSNGVSPGATFTWGLYGIQAISGSGIPTVTLAASPITGSTVAVAPAVNQLGSAVSSEFTLPSANVLIAGFVVSAPTAVDSALVWNLNFQVRHVP